MSATDPTEAEVYAALTGGVGGSVTSDEQAALDAASPALSATNPVAGMANVGGGIRVIACPFAFDTPNLLTGAAVYTPTVGDLLLDAWFEIDTAWDGTTPLGDFGMFSSGGTGWLAHLSHLPPSDMTEADSPFEAGMLMGQTTSSLGALDAQYQVGGSGIWSATGSSSPIPLSYSPGANLGEGGRLAPLKFTAANPIKVVVSQDGRNTGADPASTQGAAILYLVVATPVAP